MDTNVLVEKREMMYREALNEALVEEMARDDKVFIMGEGIAERGGSYKVTVGLLEQFGARRVFDTPISENGFTGAGVGAALTGMRPVVEILFVDFTMLVLDQIINQAAKFRFMSGNTARVPLVVRTQGGVGNGLAAQHSQSLEAIFYHIPGLRVVMPSTPYDAKGLLKAAIRCDDPVIFIEHKLLYMNKGEVPEEEYIIPLGRSRYQERRNRSDHSCLVGNDTKSDGSDRRYCQKKASVLKWLIQGHWCHWINRPLSIR